MQKCKREFSNPSNGLDQRVVDNIIIAIGDHVRCRGTDEVVKYAMRIIRTFARRGAQDPLESVRETMSLISDAPPKTLDVPRAKISYQHPLMFSAPSTKPSPTKLSVPLTDSAPKTKLSVPQTDPAPKTKSSSPTKLSIPQTDSAPKIKSSPTKSSVPQTDSAPKTKSSVPSKTKPSEAKPSAPAPFKSPAPLTKPSDPLTKLPLTKSSVTSTVSAEKISAPQTSQSSVIGKSSDLKNSSVKPPASQRDTSAVLRSAAVNVSSVTVTDDVDSDHDSGRSLKRRLPERGAAKEPVPKRSGQPKGGQPTRVTSDASSGDDSDDSDSDDEIAADNGRPVTDNGQPVVTTNGQLMTVDGRRVTTANGRPVTADEPLVTADSCPVTDNDQLIVTTNGQLVTANGQLVTAGGELVTAVAVPQLLQYPPGVSLLAFVLLIAYVQTVKMDVVGMTASFLKAEKEQKIEGCARMMPVPSGIPRGITKTKDGVQCVSPDARPWKQNTPVRAIPSSCGDIYARPPARMESDGLIFSQSTKVVPADYTQCSVKSSSQGVSPAHPIPRSVRNPSPSWELDSQSTESFTLSFPTDPFASVQLPDIPLNTPERDQMPDMMTDDRFALSSLIVTPQLSGSQEYDEPMAELTDAPFSLPTQSLSSVPLSPPSVLSYAPLPSQSMDPSEPAPQLDSTQHVETTQLIEPLLVGSVPLETTQLAEPVDTQVETQLDSTQIDSDSLIQPDALPSTDSLIQPDTQPSTDSLIQPNTQPSTDSAIVSLVSSYIGAKDPVQDWLEARGPSLQLECTQAMDTQPASLQLECAQAMDTQPASLQCTQDTQYVQPEFRQNVQTLQYTQSIDSRPDTESQLTVAQPSQSSETAYVSHTSVPLPLDDWPREPHSEATQVLSPIDLFPDTISSIVGSGLDAPYTDAAFETCTYTQLMAIQQTLSAVLTRRYAALHTSTYEQVLAQLHPISNHSQKSCSSDAKI